MDGFISRFVFLFVLLLDNSLMTLNRKNINMAMDGLKNPASLQDSWMNV